MSNQYIAVHRAVVKHGQQQHHVIVEMDEADRRSRLIINDESLNQVFESPEDAYREAVRRLNLAGQTVELTIMVAVNVMPTATAEQVFRDEGVVFDEAIKL